MDTDPLEAGATQMAIKLKRDTFLYLSPTTYHFAQCYTCRDWIEGDDKCHIHGPNVNVLETMSCGLYVQGASMPAGSAAFDIVTPTESGLVDREVRCENCKWLDGTDCTFFAMLNRELPDVFDLEVEVEPKGCCNAQQSKTD